MSNANVLLTHLPRLLVDAQTLGTDAERLTADPVIKAEVAADPVLGLAIGELSREWRTVENDVTGVKKSNILTFFPRAAALISHVGVLRGTVQKDGHDEELLAALANAPATAAALQRIEAEFVAVQADLGGK